MGQYLSTVEWRFTPDDIPLENGYLLDEKYIPREVLASILSFVDRESLSHRCKYVCKVWYDIIGKDVWKIKAEREHLNQFPHKPHLKLPSIIYKSIVWDSPYNKNVLQNCTGKYHLQHWNVLNEDRWKVEEPPMGVVGADGKKRGPNLAFVSSYNLCCKVQYIDLMKTGFHEFILDHYQPYIMISEWYSARWDCGSDYFLTVSLLSETKETIDSFDFHREMIEWRHGWEEVRYTFKNYGPGVRFVMFNHSGQDKQFWAGHYGSKMGDACVKLTFKCEE